MKQDFDKFIASAAPAVPDCGPSRRLARALMHERMHGHRRQRRIRDRWGLSLAAMLAFGLVFMGQIGQLGSDGFEVEIQSHHIDVGHGQTVQLLDSPVRGTVGVTVPGFDADDYREMQAQAVTGEGEVATLTGYSFEGQTPCWNLLIKRNINGKIITTNPTLQSLSVPNKPPSKDILPFIINKLDAFTDAIDRGEVAGQPSGLITANGIQFQVQAYSRTYPQWGLFTYFKGYPVTP